MRPANDNERTAIVQAICAHAGFDQHDYEYDQIADHCVGFGILDKYITDGPGYSGPVATVLFSGGPELTATLVKRYPGAAGAERDWAGEWEVVKPSKVEQHANELLGALQRITEINGSTGGPQALVDEFKHIARTAIAKVEA